MSTQMERYLASRDAEAELDTATARRAWIAVLIADELARGDDVTARLAHYRRCVEAEDRAREAARVAALGLQSGDPS